MSNKKNVKIIRKFLKKNDCVYLRTGKHEIWKHNKTGNRIVVCTTAKYPDHQIVYIKSQIKKFQTNQIHTN